MMTYLCEIKLVLSDQKRRYAGAAIDEQIGHRLVDPGEIRVEVVVKNDHSAMRIMLIAARRSEIVCSTSWHPSTPKNFR